ncbi:hypothetical protein [Pantoea agglomerans]|uniref:hypothetical protein n=1 Tax=Enterobacter agglomerans TaxID=549 RepID=UPI003207DE77
MNWSMISILLFFGALVVTEIILWWRVIGNIAEVVHIRRLKACRGRKYTEGAWRIHHNALIALIVAEILVALAISALIILMLPTISF